MNGLMNNLEKDKFNYGLALLAAILAFSTFKDSLAKVPIPFGVFTTNLLWVSGVSVLLMFLSVYLHAFEFILLGTRFQNSKLSRVIAKARDWAFLLSMLIPVILPVAIAVGVGIELLIKVTANKSVQDTILVVGSAISLAQAVALVLITSRLFKTRQSEIKRSRFNAFSDDIERELKETEELYKSGFYGSVVLQSFKVIELALNQRLQSEGLYATNLNTQDLIELARMHETINTTLKGKIDALRKLRNRTAHSMTDSSKDDADLALKVTREVLDIVHFDETN